MASTSKDPDYVPVHSDSAIHLVQQEDLNDFARDLNLSKEASKLLGSRLQQWKLLASGTKISELVTGTSPLHNILLWRGICVSVQTLLV